MSGFDLFFEKIITLPEIINIVAKEFNIKAREVVAVNDVEDILDLPKPITHKILLILYKLPGGDFPFRVDFFINEDIKFDRITIANNIAKTNNIKCMMFNGEGDKLYDDFAVIVFQVNGEMLEAQLKLEGYDDDIFTIEKYQGSYQRK